MSGKDSIIGRSIIIQKTTGEKISCATIYQQSFDQTSDLRADLIEGKIKGYISFQQIKGKETSIFASLSGLNDYVGPFFFHIHNFQITNGDCASTGGHYDPLQYIIFFFFFHSFFEFQDFIEFFLFFKKKIII